MDAEPNEQPAGRFWRLWERFRGPSKRSLVADLREMREIRDSLSATLDARYGQLEQYRLRIAELEAEAEKSQNLCRDVHAIAVQRLARIEELLPQLDAANLVANEQAQRIGTLTNLVEDFKRRVAGDDESLAREKQARTTAFRAAEYWRGRAIRLASTVADCGRQSLEDFSSGSSVCAVSNFERREKSAPESPS